MVSSDAGHTVLIKGLRDKRMKSTEHKEMDEFPTISEESSNSDELLQDSGTEERASMDFLNPDHMAVIGHAIGQSKSCEMSVVGQSISDDPRTKNSNGIKPVYRPVIEIDTDSDSSDQDSEYDCKPVQRAGKPVCKGDNTLVRGELTHDISKLIPKTVTENYDDEVIVVDDSDFMDDVQANRDLQLAIEKSIQDQINLVSDNSEESVNKMGVSKKRLLKSKDILEKQISNKSILSDASYEQVDMDTDRQNGTDDKLHKSGTKDIFTKQISNVSNLSSEIDIPNDNTQKAERISSKRRSSELSDKESEPKRKKTGSLAEGHNGILNKETMATLSGDESSESDGKVIQIL